MLVTFRSDKPPAICLLGPTASGKTAVAIELAAQLPCHIISVDSAQVYRHMNIGTGKPDADILARAPHSLIDIRDPVDYYSAADFRMDAIAEINKALASGRTPLLVGGTMLYFKALRDGLAVMPTANTKIRQEIETLARDQGWQQVHRRLAEVDPQAAQRIHPNDPQRLQRALEVYLASGKTLSQLHAGANDSDSGLNELPVTLHFLALQPTDRLHLHQQIERRFHAMLGAGLVEEVTALYQRDDLNLTSPAIKSVGYRQVWQYLAGDLSYDAMVERSIIATRQLAKRQLTWLRSWDNLHSLGDASIESTDRILKYLETAAI